MKHIKGYLLAAAFAVGAHACAALTPADTATVETTAGQIATCQGVELRCLADSGADAGAACYGQYDACMRDAGLR